MMMRWPTADWGTAGPCTLLRLKCDSTFATPLMPLSMWNQELPPSVVLKRAQRFEVVPSSKAAYRVRWAATLPMPRVTRRIGLIVGRATVPLIGGRPPARRVNAGGLTVSFAFVDFQMPLLRTAT